MSMSNRVYTAMRCPYPPASPSVLECGSILKLAPGAPLTLELIQKARNIADVRMRLDWADAMRQQNVLDENCPSPDIAHG